MLHETEDYKIMRLQSHQIDETTRLLAHQFTAFNPLWKAYNVPLELAFQFIRPKLLTPHMESDSLVILDANDKIVGCIIQQDMYTYIQQSKQEKVKVHHELFDKLNQIEQELEGELFSQEFIQGEVQYGIYICIDQSVQNKRVGLHILKVAYLLHQQKGIKWQYTRVTNPFTVKLLSILHANVIKQVSVKRPGNDKVPLDIYLMKGNFQNPLPQQALL